MINQKGIEKATKDLIIALGLNLKDPNLIDTPKRIARMYKEILAGLLDDGKEAEKLLSKVFPSNNDQMIIVKNIKAYSMCPHHFLPVDCTIHIGYIPKGKVLGLSKLARVAELYAKRPILQEDLAEEIAFSIEKYVKPLGVMVVIEGQHYCMVMRGVKKRESTTVTSCVKGCFRNPKERAREEFLKLVYRK